MTPPGGGAAGVSGALPPVVGEAAGIVLPALREACERLSPQIAAVVGYHVGWLDTGGRPADLRGGKSVRGALALCSARAAGADASAGIPGAVAVELVHTFSLLHDDIMDGDRERHGRPAAWAAFGQARAILAGDAALALAYRVLLDAGPVGGGAALESLATATERLIDGQALDLDLGGRVDATPEDCIRMCAGKTGALLECAASIGAVLAGAGRAVVEPLAAFGGHLGLAFQAVDDLLGIWGDPAVTGKPVFGDLVQRKTSLPVAIALGAGGEDGRELANLLGRTGLDAAQIERAAALVESCGGRAGAAEQAAAELALGLAALDGAPIDPGARAELAAIARFVAAREF
jgi:geranylgeranyl diphosphate synthase, type I